MQRELSEQEIVRRDALKKIKDLGINPYPADLFPVDVTAKDIHENYERDKLSYKSICIAGRLMGTRVMGKASFSEMQDSTGRIQVYVNRDEICPGDDKTLYNDVYKKLLDIGDIIGIKGYVFTTQVGEITIHATELVLLTKSLRPIPIVKTDKDGNIHDGFNDPETRYRQRYVDLIVNPHVKDAFIKRTQLTNSMRNYLNNKGYMEVETPILQPIYGGAAARPFKTHHNTLDMSNVL